MALQRPRSWTEIEEDEAYKALAPDRKLKLLGHWTDQVRDYASATGALSRDYNVSAINDFRSQKEQEITAAAAPPPEKPFFRLGDVGSALAGIPEDLYYGVPVAMRRLSEGLNRPDQYSESSKQAFAAERARLEEEQKLQQERELRGETSVMGDALRQASDSAAFSIANMAVAAPAGAAASAAVSAAFPPAAPITAPLAMAAGASAAMLTSAPVAYRIAGNQFMDDAVAELTKKKGSPLTEEEIKQAYDELLPVAQNTALWEAGPEAIGNAVTLGAGKFVFGFGEDVATNLAAKALGQAGKTASKEYALNTAAVALAKTGVKAPTAELIEATAEQALKEAGKTGIRRAVEKGAAVLADTSVETTTEAITQTKQGYDQAKMQQYVQTGSTEGAVNEYEGLAGFGKAYKEVFGPTVATLGLFGATAGAVKAASNVMPGKNLQKKEQVIDDIVTGAAALTNELQTTGSPQTAKTVGDMAAKQAQRILSDQQNQEDADDETTREILDDMEAKAAAEKPPTTTEPTAASPEDAEAQSKAALERYQKGEITFDELSRINTSLNRQQRNVARGEGSNPLQQYVDKAKLYSNDVLDLLFEYGGVEAQTLADVQNPEAVVAWLKRNDIGERNRAWRGRTLTPFGDQGAGTPLFDQAPKEPAAAPKVPVEFSPETLAGQTDDEFNESERVVRGAVDRLADDDPRKAPAQAALVNIEAERERRGAVKPKQPAPAPRTLDQFTDDELDQEETLLQRKVEAETDPVLLEEANAQLQAVAAERQRRNPPKPAAPVVDKKQPAPAPKTLDQFTDDELDQEETLLQRTIDTETDPVVVEETNTKLQAVAAERQRRATLTLKPSAPSAPKVTNTSRENLVLVSGQPELPKQQQDKKDIKPKVEDSPDQGKLNLGEGGAGTQRDVKLTEGLRASGVKVTNPSEAAANYRKSLVEEARKARRLSPVKDIDTVLKDLEGQAWVPPQYKSPVRRREFAKQLLDEARTARSEELGVGTKTIVPGSQAEAKIYDDSISKGQVPSAKKILNRLSKEANVGKKTGNFQTDEEREARLENLRQQTREIQTEASRLVAATLGIPNPESVTFAPDFTGKNSLPQRSVTKGKVTKLENIFVNDADITARQLDRGMDITIPKGQRNNVVEGITYDRKTGKVTAAVSGDTIVSKPDQLKVKRDTKRKKLDATFTVPEESQEKLGANGQPDPNGKTRFGWAMERARELTGEAEKKWSATVTNIARAEITGWSANLGERVRTVALVIASESALKGKNITATEAIKQASQKFSERVRTRPDLATEYSLDQTVGTSGATGYDLTPDGPQRGVGPQGTRSDASKLLARMTNAEAARIMTDLSQKLDEDRPLTAVEKQSLSAAQEFTNLRDQLRFQGKLKNIPESELPELTYGELLNISGEDPQLQGRFADETMGAGAAQTSAPNIDNLPDDSYLSADSAVNPEEEEKIQVTEEEIAQAKALVDSVWKTMPMIGRIIETLYRGARAFVTAGRRDAVYVNFANIARAIQGLDEDAARTFIKRLLNHEGRHLALLRNMTLEDLKEIGNGMTQAQKLAAGMSYYANYKYTSEEQRAADMKKFMEDPTTMAIEYLTMLSERMQAGESVQDLDLKNFPKTTLQKIIAALRAILTQFQTRMLMRSEYNAALAVGIGRLEKGIRDLENEANMAERIEEANAADENGDRFMSRVQPVATFEFKTRKALEDLIENRKRGSFKGITTAPDGTVPWQNLEAKIRKSTSKVEAEMILPILETLVIDGRIGAVEANNFVAQLAEENITATFLPVAGGTDLAGLARERATIVHDLDTMYPGWHDLSQRRASENSLEDQLLRFDRTITDPQLRLLLTRLAEIESVDPLEEADQAQANIPATQAFQQVNPKPLKEMSGAGDVLVQVPLRRPHPSGKIRLSDVEDVKRKLSGGGVVFREPFHYPHQSNVLGFGRQYIETLPNGEKAMFAFEIQSDWSKRKREVADRVAEGAQAIRGAKEAKSYDRDFYMREVLGYDIYSDRASRVGSRPYRDPAYKATSEIYEDIEVYEFRLSPNGAQKLIHGVDKDDAIRNWELKVRNDSDFRDHPLVDVHESLVLKSLIQRALGMGITKFVLPDAETAMMTEGHDMMAAARMENLTGRIVKNPGADGVDFRLTGQVYTGASENGELLVMALLGIPEGPVFLGNYDVENDRNEVAIDYTLLTGKTDWGGDQGADVLDVFMNDNGLPALPRGEALRKQLSWDIPQERGMRAAYDVQEGRNHAMLRKWTKDAGKRVDFGEHQNVKTSLENSMTAALAAGGSPVFKNPDGSPKTNITGVVYDISSLADNPAMSTIFQSRADDYTPEIPERTATPSEITSIQQKNRDAAKAYLDTLPPGAYDVVDENGDPVGSIEVRMQERTGTARKEGVSPTKTKIRPEGPQDLFGFMGEREIRGFGPQTQAPVRTVSFIDLEGMPQPTSRALDALVPNPKGKDWSLRSVVPQQRFESRAEKSSRAEIIEAYIAKTKTQWSAVNKKIEEVENYYAQQSKPFTDVIKERLKQIYPGTSDRNLDTLINDIQLALSVETTPPDADYINLNRQLGGIDGYRLGQRMIERLRFGRNSVSAYQSVPLELQGKEVTVNNAKNAELVGPVAIDGPLSLALVKFADGNQQLVPWPSIVITNTGASLSDTLSVEDVINVPENKVTGDPDPEIDRLLERLSQYNVHADPLRGQLYEAARKINNEGPLSESELDQLSVKIDPTGNDVETMFQSRADLGVDDDGYLRPMQDARGRTVYRVKINGIPFETTAPDAETAVRNAAARMFDDAKVVRFEGGRYTSVGGLIAAMTKNAKVWWGKNWANRYARPAVRVAPDRTPILPATKSEQAELPLYFASMADPSLRVRVGQVNPEGRPKGGFWDRLKLMVRGRFSETRNRTGGISGSGAATPRERDAILAAPAKVRGTMAKVEMTVRSYRKERKKYKEFTEEQINAALGHTENPYTDAQAKELSKIKNAKDREAKEEEFRKANAATDRLVRQQALSQLPGFNPKFDGETEFHTGLAKAVEDMRIAIDEMSQALMEGDYIPADLKPRVEQNLNVYVHRSYTIFDNPLWKQFMLEPQTDEHRRIQSGAVRLFQKYAVAELAMKEIAKEKAKGNTLSRSAAIKTASTKKEEIATIAANMLVEYLSIADDKANNFFVTGELPGQRKLDIIKVRGQIPKEIRELWGEIQKADDNFTKTMAKMAGYMAATDTARELVRVGLEQKYMWKEGVSEGPRPAGYQLIYRPGEASSMSVSPMDDVYAPEEVGKFMRSFRDHKTLYGWARLLTFWTSQVMAMKTIGNLPQGYVRNFFGNPFIMINGGYITPMHPVQMFKSMRKAMQVAWNSSGLGNQEAMRKSVSELTAAGVVGEGLDSSLLREMAGTELGDVTWKRLYEAGAYENMARRLGRQTKGGYMKTMNVLSKIYQGVDDFWKVFAYEMEKFYQRRAHSDWTEKQIADEAIQRIRNKVPTYSLSPEMTKRIREIPFLAPFITWTSETIRTSANNLAIAAEDIRVGKETGNAEMVENGRRALFGFVFALTAFPTLALISKAMAGYDDDDEDAYRESLPEWEKNATLMFLGTQPDGTGKHWNLSFLDPYQSRVEGPTAFMRAIRSGDGLAEAMVKGVTETMRPLISEQLLFGAITSILRNRTAQGRPIYNEQDTAFNKTYDTLSHLALAAGPGTVVGAGRRLYLASQGTVLPGGQTYDVGNELVGMFGGQKVSSIDFRTTLNNAKNKYASSKAEATQLFSRVFSSTGSVDLNDIGPAYENAARAHRELQEFMIERFNDAIRMGIPRKEAIRILRGSLGDQEISKDDLRAILRGVPRRWTPSEVSLDSAKEGKIPDGRARLKALRDYMRSIKTTGEQ